MASKNIETEERKDYVDVLTSIIDLSNNRYHTIKNMEKLQTLYLTEIYLAYNNLKKVPCVITNLLNIKKIDLSFNEIEYFDDTPSFCDQVEHLNLSHNKLRGPPYWVWHKSPRNLKFLDLSYNISITDSLQDKYYFEELLRYENPVIHIRINNCKLNSYIKLLDTLPKVKILDIGTEDTSNLLGTNDISDFPRRGLQNCCYVEKLDLSYTYISFINTNICKYTNLKEINLSYNRLSDLPTEFCYLENLEICLLSNNYIMFLPEEFNKLKKLVILTLSKNNLCMLPDIRSFPKLVKLDVYDNKLYDLPDGVDNILEVDLAQNYFDEPFGEEYLIKKSKLRKNLEVRTDGRKYEIELPDCSKNTESCEESINSSNSSLNDYEAVVNTFSSSSEDWDSDDYWVPHYISYSTSTESPWLLFAKTKMAEGSFCPMDAHPISVVDKVKNEKQSYTQEYMEIEGQFDDFSGDDS